MPLPASTPPAHLPLPLKPVMVVLSAVSLHVPFAFVVVAGAVEGETVVVVEDIVEVVVGAVEGDTVVVVVDGMIVEHDTPLPVNPLRHVQVLEPSVLPQSASEWHPPLLVAHSSMSVQFSPLPE